MNTKELADELQKLFLDEKYDRLVHEIPDVLRQPADRIVELQNDYAELNMKFNAVTQMQADRIAELEKENDELKSHVSTLFQEYKQYWQTQQHDKDSTDYQKQAAQLWNDSCTSNRKG